MTAKRSSSPNSFLEHVRAQRLLVGLLLTGALFVIGVSLAHAFLGTQLTHAIDIALAVLTIIVIVGLVEMALRGMRRESAHRLAAAVEAERQVMSRELHDSVAQHLCYLHMRLDQFSQAGDPSVSATLRAEMEELREVANEAYEQLYRLVSALRVAPAGNLADALMARAALASHRGNFKTELISVGAPRQITPEAAEEIVQIINEALMNVAKHAQAHALHLSICWDPDALRITAQDNGRGFDPAAVADCGRFGLRIMEERTEMLGGKLQIDSQPGAGARAELTIPLSRILDTHSPSAQELAT